MKKIPIFVICVSVMIIHHSVSKCKRFLDFFQKRIQRKSCFWFLPVWQPIISPFHTSSNPYYKKKAPGKEKVRKDVRPDAGKGKGETRQGVAEDPADTGDSGYADPHPGNRQRRAFRRSYSIFPAGAGAIPKLEGTGF